MASWDTTALREKGDLEGARRNALRDLAEDPTNVWNKRAFAWVLHDEVREIVRKTLYEDWSAQQGASAAEHHVKELVAIDLPTPDIVFGRMAAKLRELQHTHGALLTLVAGCGLAGFSDEYREPRVRKDGTVYEPLVVTVALRAAQAATRGAWPRDVREAALRFVEGVIEDGKAREGWPLEYRRTLLLSALGRREEAKAAVIPVLRLQPGAFWAWTALGIALEAEPEKAFAAHARAWLTCTTEKYRVGIDERLAVQAIRVGRFDVARWAVTHAAGIRKEEGWRSDEALHAFVHADSFASAPEVVGEPESFLHAIGAEADALLHDPATPHRASFLERFTARGGEVMASVSIAVGPRTVPAAFPARLLPEGDLRAGEPLTAWAIGDGEKPWVTRMERRSDGAAFDAVPSFRGVVDHVNAEKHLTSIYLPGEDFVPLRHDRFPDAAALAPGTGVEVFATQWTNASITRTFAHAFRICPVPMGEWIAARRGAVKATAHGYGWLGSVFVPQELLRACPPDDPVTLLAVRRFDRRRGSWSWRALARLPDSA